MTSKHYSTFALVFLTAAATILLAGKCSTAFSNLCLESHFPELCKQIGNGELDPMASTQMAIRALSLWASNARALAVKLGSNTCAQAYDAAIDHLQNTSANIQSGDKAALKANLSSVLANFNTCSNIITGGGGGGHLADLASSNELMQKLGSYSLTLANEIHF